MTDSTPHESLPNPADALVPRQYFRLVVGEVTAWFADHSTANPLGILPPEGVRIVKGNKFELYRHYSPFRCWEIGRPADLKVAGEEKQLRQLLYQYRIGHLADRIVKVCKVKSIAQLLEWAAEDSRDFLDPHDYGSFYHDLTWWQIMIDDLTEKVVKA